MSVWWAIAGMGAGIYLMRVSGLVLPGFALPKGAERALRFVPVALLSALVLVTLDPAGPAGWDRLLAAAGAGAVARVTGRMWACIVCGVLLYWLFRFG